MDHNSVFTHFEGNEDVEHDDRNSNNNIAKRGNDRKQIEYFIRLPNTTHVHDNDDSTAQYTLARKEQAGPRAHSNNKIKRTAGHRVLLPAFFYLRIYDNKILEILHKTSYNKQREKSNTWELRFAYYFSCAFHFGGVLACVCAYYALHEHGMGKMCATSACDTHTPHRPRQIYNKNLCIRFAFMCVCDSIGKKSMHLIECTICQWAQKAAAAAATSAAARARER